MKAAHRRSGLFIVDAHLDLAYNAVRGRDLLLPANRQQPDEEGIPSVGLPDLLAGGVGLICATIFCQPANPPSQTGYRNPAEATSMGHRQLQWYQKQERQDRLRLVRNAADLPDGSNGDNGASSAPLKALLLLEGADAIGSPAELPAWFDPGLRIIGLAWKRTRYAGGTGAPGPLTPQGVELVRAIDRIGIIHDLSHLAEDA